MEQKILDTFAAIKADSAADIKLHFDSVLEDRVQAKINEYKPAVAARMFNETKKV